MVNQGINRSKNSYLNMALIVHMLLACFNVDLRQIKVTAEPDANLFYIEFSDIVHGNKIDPLKFLKPTLTNFNIEDQVLLGFELFTLESSFKLFYKYIYNILPLNKL